MLILNVYYLLVILFITSFSIISYNNKVNFILKINNNNNNKIKTEFIKKIKRNNFILFSNNHPNSISYDCKPLLIYNNSIITNSTCFTIFSDELIALPRHRTTMKGIFYNPVMKSQKKFLESCKSFLPITPYDGAIEINIIFFFKRPKIHYRSGKNSHILKPDSDVWHYKRKGYYCSYHNHK